MRADAFSLSSFRTASEKINCLSKNFHILTIYIRPVYNELESKEVSTVCPFDLLFCNDHFLKLLLLLLPKLIYQELFIFYYFVFHTHTQFNNR